MGIRILNGRVVEQLLPMPRCIELMRVAMRLEADGQAVQPVRTRMETPGSRNLLTMMPGLTRVPATLGIKVVTVFPDNFGSAFGSHQGMVLMFNPQNGAPVGVVDGRAVTAIRTAAATAVATDVLARPEARTLAVLGYGEQARTHLAAVSRVRSFERVLLWGRDPIKAAAFAAEIAAALPLAVEAVADAESACSADVITAVTAASEPVIRGGWLRPGTHVNLVGSSIPSTAEIDDDGVRRARFFGDSVQGVLALGGEFGRALASGAIDEAHLLGTVGDILAGKVAGRRDADEVTIFKSLGMVAEDLVTCDELLREAARLEEGDVVDW